jgi:uncharacterized protein
MKIINGNWGITFVLAAVLMGAAPHATAQTPWTVLYLKSAAALEAHDYPKALAGFRALADVGSPAAEATLGHMYFHGYGVARNMRTAAVWYFRASEKGYPPAQLVLGHMFAQGLGFTANPERAYFWLALAAVRGDNKLSPRASTYRDKVAKLLSVAKRSEIEASIANWRPSAAVPR